LKKRVQKKKKSGVLPNGAGKEPGLGSLSKKKNMAKKARLWTHSIVGSYQNSPKIEHSFDSPSGGKKSRYKEVNGV